MKKRGRSHSAQIALAKDLIKPVGQVEDSLTMLVYAKGGKGKTSFACSGAMDGMKTLLIDFNEKGHISVKRQKNIDYYHVDYWEKLDDLYWYLKSGKHPYKVVILDTVSSMAVIGMRWVLGDDATRDANRDPLMPDKRSWGKLAALLNTSFSNWRNLEGVHVIFTAHERTTEYDTEEENVVTIETHPALSPAPRENLISMVHIVGRIFKKEVVVKEKGKKPTKKFEWRMLVGDDEKYVTKLRQDPTSDVIIPRVVRKPTLKYFIDQILPELEKENDGEED